MSEPYDIISSYNDLCCIEMDFISLTCLITISLFALAFSMRIIGADRPCIRLFPSSLSLFTFVLNADTSSLI